MTDHATDDRDAVVVTGTSTGIGAACVRQLVDLGFSVFAGVRREGDALIDWQRIGNQFVAQSELDRATAFVGGPI